MHMADALVSPAAAGAMYAFSAAAPSPWALAAWGFICCWYFSSAPILKQASAQALELLQAYGLELPLSLQRSK